MTDLRHLFGAARDQGPRPTCLAFAMSDAHGAALGQTGPLAADYAHYHAARRQQVTMNQAVSTISMRQAVDHDGQPTEVACPYTAPRADSWSPPLGIQPLWRRGSVLAAGVPSAALTAALAAGMPSVLTLRINESFYLHDAVAFEVADDLAKEVGAHAIVVVAARTAAAGRSHVLARKVGAVAGAWKVTRGCRTCTSMREPLTSFSFENPEVTDGANIRQNA